MANASGLVTVESNLDIPRLLDAYRHGIFPWPTQLLPWSWFPGNEGWYIGWYSPDPRAILPLHELRITRRLRRKLNGGQFRFTWNREFESVLDYCATLGQRSLDRWLSPELMDGLTQLHQIGHAHSIEAYHAADGFGALCGGLYGVSVGSCFSAESMFYLRSDASKAALCALVELLAALNFQLLDIQQPSSHMASLGAIEIDRHEFLRLLADSQSTEVEWARPPENPVELREILTLARKQR